MHTLAPVQRKALDALVAAARPGKLVAIQASPGTGKTTILRAAHERLGGRLLTAGDVQHATAGRHPLAIEDGLHALLDDALDESSPLFLDDVDLVAGVVEGCHMYPRGGYLQLVVTSLAERAAESDRTIVFATSMITPALGRRCEVVALHEFEADDYRAICAAYLSPIEIAAIDFAKVYRFARRLNARQLRRACKGIRAQLDASPNTSATDALIEYLRAAQLVSNVDLGEVQTVRLEDLRGIDGVLRALEANVILPLEHSELAEQLSLKPKRGVLLAGPPGTGKTTIGRALAHRLRGKFFLVDGTVIAGTPMFYQQLHHVFEAAMRNAPSVVFIDDSDVIFEGQDPGLYRYLLTMLDGLESESAGGVCLMMTAMDVGSLPPALVRSGRIELWLETQLPDEGARLELLTDLCRPLPARPSDFELDQLAKTAEGLSGADLKRLVEDGKVLYAYDHAQGRPTRSMYEYFNESLATVRENKERYAAAEASARMRNPTRPPYFNSSGVMAMAARRAMAAGAEGVSFVRAVMPADGGA
jgi:ATP-dependent 26S proteasome regulatory subunit